MISTRVCFKKFFYKRSAGFSSHTETGINSKNQQLAEELPKQIIGKLKKRKLYSSLTDKAICIKCN